MKRFYHASNPGYLEWSVVLIGWIFQLTWWRGPPRSAYYGIELNWWPSATSEAANESWQCQCGEPGCSYCSSPKQVRQK